MNKMTEMSNMVKKIYVAPQTVAETIVGAGPFLGSFPSTLDHGSPPGEMPARRTAHTSPVF